MVSIILFHTSKETIKEALFIIEKAFSEMCIRDREATDEERKNFYPVSIYCPVCGKDTTCLLYTSGRRKLLWTGGAGMDGAPYWTCLLYTSCRIQGNRCSPDKNFYAPRRLPPFKRSASHCRFASTPGCAFLLRMMQHRCSPSKFSGVRFINPASMACLLYTSRCV